MDLPSTDREDCGELAFGDCQECIFREVSFGRTTRFQVDMLSLICEPGGQEGGLIWSIINIKVGVKAALLDGINTAVTWIDRRRDPGT